MSELAGKFKELNDAVKPHNVGSAEHREAVRTLEIFVHANADEMIETLAEIARLRADVERLREVLDEARTTCRRAAAMFVEIYGEDRSANERWCRATMEAITAALADTADTKGLNDG